MATRKEEELASCAGKTFGDGCWTLWKELLSRLEGNCWSTRSADTCTTMEASGESSTAMKANFIIKVN